MKNNFNKAFTLVELIVVITILAVLATVAFISFQGYSSESRDTKRMTDIATISKGLQVYLAKNSQVPEPSETKTTVSYSGSQLLTQGYAGDSVLNTIAVKDAKDPVDNQFYTYSTNANNTKFQVLALLEKDQTANLISNTTFADYSDRNIYSAGQSVGILVDDTNTPIQELGNTTVDLQSTSDSFQTILSQNNISSQTGSNLQKQILGAQENLFGWRAFDPNCPIEDIHIGDQVWAGCNSTLGNGMEWGQLDSDVGNGTYSSTDIACHDYDGSSPAAIYKYCEAGSDDMLSKANAQNYFSHVQPDNINNSGDREINTIWGKLYMWEDAMNACPAGWHLPNLVEWENSLQVLNNSVACGIGGAGSVCDGQGWLGHSVKNNTNNIVNKLAIPLAGYRHDNRIRFDQRGILTYFWFAYGENPDPYRVRFSQGGTTVNINQNTQDYAFSVRCIKD